MLGPLFEHLVAQSVLVYAQAAGARVGHLRQRDARHEVDLIVELGQRAVAIEVKLAQTVDAKDVRHLLWLKSELGDRLADMVVVTTGPYAYRRQDGVAVVPAALLGP
jgi:predicted AAA+ superfamily ATPase